MSGLDFTIPAFPPPSLPWVTAVPVPTGGAISFGISGAPSGQATLTRAVSGVSGSTVIYSGAVTPYFLDIGDQLPSPLNPTLYYQYIYTDNSGTFTTDFINPSSNLSILQEPLANIFIKLLQGAFNSLALPAGINRCEVLYAMPLGGIPNMPFVVINQDLMQQSNVPIGASTLSQAAVTGQGTPIPGGVTFGWSISSLVERTYRVSVMSRNAVERDYYRDALAGIFEALFQPVLQPLGLDVTHKWQVTTGQVVDVGKGMSPGFYFSEYMLTFEGTANITVSQNYGLVSDISATIDAAQELGSVSGVSFTIEVPN